MSWMMHLSFLMLCLIIHDGHNRKTLLVAASVISICQGINKYKIETFRRNDVIFYRPLMFECLFMYWGMKKDVPLHVTTLFLNSS